MELIVRKGIINSALAGDSGGQKGILNKGNNYTRDWVEKQVCETVLKRGFVS